MGAADHEVRRRTPPARGCQLVSIRQNTLQVYGGEGQILVGSRGFEPRSARSERAASANCATSRCGDHGRIRTANRQALDLSPLPRLGYVVSGPSGWIRTTTARVKSPECCVDTTEGLELIPGVEPGRRPYQDRRLPLHQISVERMVGLDASTRRVAAQSSRGDHAERDRQPRSARSERAASAICAAS